jgi:nitrous oxidase accessory protein NosD
VYVEKDADLSMSVC